MIYSLALGSMSFGQKPFGQHSHDIWPTKMSNKGSNVSVCIDVCRPNVIRTKVVVPLDCAEEVKKFMEYLKVD
jgi:hypothetical protein